MKKLIFLFTIIIIFCTGCTENTISNEIEKSESVKKEKQEISVTESKDSTAVPAETTASEKTEVMKLSEENMEKVQQVIEAYYQTISRTITDTAPIEKPPTMDTEYEGYAKNEIVFYEVTAEDVEAKRYIAVGSKDEWKTCVVLNEGY